MSASATPPLWKVYLAAFMAQVCWSGQMAMSKVTINSGIDPVTVAGIRSVGSMLIFGTLAFIIDGKQTVLSPSLKADGPVFLAMGVAGIVLNLILGTYGAKLASASEGSFLQPGITVFTAFLSVAFKYEKPNRWKALAVLGAVGGSLIILFARPISIDPNNSTHTAGLLCFVGQTFMWSLSVILQKPVLQRFPALTVIFWTMLVGGIINGAIGAYFASQLDWSAVSINALYSILYMILIGTVGAWQLNAFANQHLPPTITGMAICAQAILGAILGFVILGERITLQHVAGGVVIIGSVALIIYVRNMELREAEQQALTEKTGDSESKTSDVALTVQQVYVESAVESKPDVTAQPKKLPAVSNKAPANAKKASTVVTKKTENPIAVEKVFTAPGELLMDSHGRITLA